MGYHTKEVRFNTYADECDECRKYRRGWQWCYQYHFETMDGGDYLWHDECWRCHIIGIVRNIKYRLKAIPKKVKTICECWSWMNKLPWYSRQRFNKAFSLARKMKG